ncbi:unnamed protein product [Rhodiola kirilowii]
MSKNAIDSERLLDGGTSNYEPSSECCVDHPFEQMGLRVPHLSSESPSDGKERHICEHSKAEGSGKCVGKLSCETHQGTHVPMQIGSCSYEHSRMTCSASCKSVQALDVEGEPSDVHKLTFCDMPEKEEQGEVNSSDECPSQYVKDSYDETEGQITYSSNHDDPLCFEEALTDVPAHHCIDGSVVYMMTPASAPPTADSVRDWVFEFDSLAHSCEEKLHDARPDIGEPNKEDHENKIMAVDAGCDEGKKVLVNEAESVKKVCTNVFQDFSQISGPFGNSKATPLSQTGFRDPASIGCGQQLTLLSLEILAESRGDLRPDPRYDAIKVLAFAVKDDNDSVASLYALLHTPENERNLDGLSSCNILHFNEERHMFNYMVDFILSLDPDVFLGWDIQGASLGFLIERASQLGIGLLNKISRTPLETKVDCNNSEGLEKIFHGDVLTEFGDGDSVLLDGGAIEDEWGRTHASGLHVDGRIVLNVWRLMRSEVKLTMYTVEAVAEAVLRRKVSFINNKVLASWFSSGPSRARYRSIEFVVERAKLNLEIMDQLDMINRTSELARVFGIEFFSVLSRGSQYRVESMLLRLAHSQNYIAISPGSQQVATQPAMECLPLVMEPKSGFYADPVIVLDFQSLYPSMIIAYNLCFCTCLGKLVPPKPNILGVSSYSPEPHVLHKLKDEILFTPNGVMYVPPEVRKGVLPRLLDEILSTRIMVKQAMKKLDSSQKVLQRIFNSRQLALKLISNVTYGYTAAGFSGRMPCAELADSIVQCGRRTLETAITFVNANETWRAKVIYGDTDSLFVLLEGRTVEEAFRIGKEIAADVTRMNPDPVTLKMEKVYHPCFLLTKKRYVGYSYESPDQIDPIFDAKGIETVRRDTCGAVAKTMEQSLRLYFEHQDISKVKAYLQRQWKRIISGRVSLQDFIFAKEVRLGTYSTRNSSSLPPAAIVATKAMRVDPRAEPRYGERVPYIVVHGDPGARLVDMVVDPLDLLALDSPFRLNDQYYINKQIIPALQRVFGLVGADLSQWLSEIPRPIREAFGKRQLYNPNPYRARIDHYYISKHCILCGELAQSSKHLCENCSRNKTAMATTVIVKTTKLEKDMQHLVAVCCHCGGGDWIVETGVKCTSLACSVFYERRKVQKELLSMSAVATETGLYPKCMAELF